jgi:hypothetical protein
MRLNTRDVLLALIAVFAMSAVATSAASATTPEFKPVPAKKKFTSSGGAATFKQSSGGLEINCTTTSAAGEITGARTVGKLVLKYTGCHVENKPECAVKSTSAGHEGEILTRVLEGELGTVKTSEAPSGVAVRLKGEEKKIWDTLAGGSCNHEEIMNGDVAAEIPVIGKKQATNKLVLVRHETSQAIKAITLDSGKLEEPQMALESTTMTMEGTGELKFEEALEVT